jgi:hypothetical protein
MWDPKLYDDRHAFVWQHGTALLNLLADGHVDRRRSVGTAKSVKVGCKALTFGGCGGERLERLTTDLDTVDTTAGVRTMAA